MDTLSRLWKDYNTMMVSLDHDFIGQIETEKVGVYEIKGSSYLDIVILGKQEKFEYRAKYLYKKPASIFMETALLSTDDDKLLELSFYNR